MAFGGGKNLGTLMSMKLMTFLNPAGGSSVKIDFSLIPPVAPDGSPYEIINLYFKYPTGALIITNFTNGAILTARTLWSCFRFSFSLGTNSPQAKMAGPSEPNVLMRQAPGNMVADFLALHSGQQIVDVDGIAGREEVFLAAGAASVKPGVCSRATREHVGFACLHGPIGTGDGALDPGTTEAYDFIWPLGTRRQWFGFEDTDDTAVPSHWLSGAQQGASGIRMDPATLTIENLTTTEGGLAVTHAAAVTVEVWADILVRRDGRASCPVLPIFRHEAPPGNSANVDFWPGLHFFSGFTTQDTTGRGNVNANLDVQTQTFGSFQLVQGRVPASYVTAAEYLRTLRILTGRISDTRVPFVFDTSDAPFVGVAMAATCRRRMGLFPVALPLPGLLSASSDGPNQLRASYTAASPVNPYVLQELYPIHTADSMNLAARSSGIPDAEVVNAVDSVNPDVDAQPFLPKMIRRKAA